MRTRNGRFLLAMVAAAGLLLGAAAGAQEPGPELVAAAKKEGKIVIYGSLIQPTQRAIKAGFEKKYPGIDVELLYMSSGPLMNRFSTETSSGQHLADVIAFDANFYPEILKRGLLAKYESVHGPRYAKEWHSDPPGYWITTHTFGAGIIYNKKMVAADRVPASYEDLLKPEWRGKIAMVSTTANEVMSYWAAGMVKDRGEKAFDFFKALATQRPLSFGPGVRVSQGVASGEFPVGLGFVGHAYTMGGDDNVIGFVKTETIYQTSGPGTGVLARAPHPNAARLMADYINSKEGQELITIYGYRSNYEGVKQPEGMESIKVSVAPVLEKKDAEALRARLQSIFGM